ncbi:hypothetical protein C3444_06050 [Escherichia coli]|nr:hypothetical protein C3443_07870 [Escherichia coli]ROW70866.1 hypothetical protein C3444_06050 [Escherichia coli]
MKQGGVLVPRKYHLIRTAYEINEEPTAYGDHGIRIYGIWSPIAEGKICTHAVKWKMVRKAVDVQEAAADQGACAPWTRGNNCPLAENLYQQGKDKSADGDTRTDITRMDDKELHDYLHSMNKKERRELAARLRLVKPKRRRDYKQRISEVNAELYEFRRRQQMLGYASLAEVPAEQLDGKSERIQHYFNAVYCWARAMLNERYQDYDATASGVKRGEELAEASGDLWRDARWAISRVCQPEQRRTGSENAVGTPATRRCIILATTGGRAGRSLHRNACEGQWL